jgi:hypothetical protein
MASKLLHHGNCSGEFEPCYTGTDYFNFRHTPCRGKANCGLCEITAILIDNQGRVIFNLKCVDCGSVDALKTSPQLLRYQRLKDALEVFHLSPNLKSRIKRHWWDDL